MKKQVMALALSLLLGGGSPLTGVALAAGKPLASRPSQAPELLKTGIAQTSNSVELTQGKAHVLHLNRPASRVSISDPEVVGLVMLSPTEIQLIGKSTGVANLLVWSAETGDRYLTVDLSVHRDVSTLASKIQMVDPGINVLPVAAEDSVILTGVAESLEKAQLAFDITKAYFADDAKGSGGGSDEMSSNSPGSSSMTNGSTKIINLIRVMGQPTTKAEMVGERLKDIDPNIVFKVVPGFGGKEKAILTGRVRNASMVSKAVNLASVFYGTPGIKVLTGPGGNAVKEGREQDAGGGFSVGSGGGLIGNLAGNILHGSIITDTSGNVVSMLEVEERPQVKCTIKFMEVQKTSQIDIDSATSLRIGNTLSLSSFSTSQGGVVGPGGSGTTTLNPVNLVNGSQLAKIAVHAGDTFSMVLAGLITSGKARVLAEPTITSISGEPATFLAGGEFPIPVIGANGSASIVFKEFGIRLDLLSTVTDRGTIHMQVSPEVSSLDKSNGVAVPGASGVTFTVPALRSRRGQTVVEMNDGDNFVLGGLYNEDMSDIYAKTPLLGQIPVLGALFRSRAYRRGETEMVIVIHPEIQSNMNLSNVEPAYRNAPVVSQTIKLDPQELYKELHAAEGNKSIPSGSLNPVLKPSASVVSTSNKADEHALKLQLKALKKQHREEARLVREQARAQRTALLPSTPAVETMKASSPPLAVAPVATVQQTTSREEQGRLLKEVLDHLTTPSAEFPADPATPVTAPTMPRNRAEQPLKSMRFS